MADVEAYQRMAESDLKRCEDRIEKGLASMIDSAKALREIHDGRLYKASGEYDSFESYCKGRWGMSRARAYQLVNWATVRDNIAQLNTKKSVYIVDISEPIARHLTKLPDAKTQGVALDTARERAGDKLVTPSVVRKVVDEILVTDEFVADEEEEAEPEPPKPVLDKAGNEVPERLHAVFEDATKFDEHIRSFQAGIKFVARLAESEETTDRYLDVSQFQKEAGNARHLLRHARPWAVCPQCHGKRGRCATCQGEGWINQQAHKNLTK